MRGAGRLLPSHTAGETPAPQLAAAGPRLVTTDGFGCTSCHQVGSVLPDKAPLNARGPTLSMLEKRIRREWFDRWCANPARIVPRMEMPSVQVPVRGVLNDNIHDQLAAVWHTLNTPGFEPPEPNPVRVLRLSGVPEAARRQLHRPARRDSKTATRLTLPARHRPSQPAQHSIRPRNQPPRRLVARRHRPAADEGEELVLGDREENRSCHQGWQSRSFRSSSLVRSIFRRSVVSSCAN